MFNYAQLDENNIVIGISQLSGEDERDSMVLITDLEVAIGSTFNRETGEFKISEQPPVNPKPTLEEMQAQTLLNTEYLVSRTELGL